MKKMPARTCVSACPACQRRDEQLFLRLYKKYKSHFYQIAFSFTQNKLASEDISQELFLKLWQQKETLSKVKDMHAYVTILARNSSIDYMRKRKHESNCISRYAQIKNRCFDLMEELDTKETVQLLQLAIQSLTQHRRTVFVLGWMEGWNRRQIAAYLDISENTVKASMQNARKDIASFMTRNGAGVKSRKTVLMKLSTAWVSEKLKVA